MASSTKLAALRHELRPTLRIALPLVFAELGWMSMSVVDTIMVGRLPNAALAIGAAGLASGLYYTIAIFGSGLLLGLDTLVAQAFGRDDLHDARHSLFNSLVLALGLAPLLMVAVSFWPPLMTRVGVQPEIVTAMRPFLAALNWGTLPLMAYFALRRYLQAVQIVKPVTFALISANVVNALFNWIFIYGHLGMRPMGLAGSGWSTCLARVYMAAALLLTLAWSDRRRRLGLRAAGLRVELRRMRHLLALGFPAALQILIEIGAFSAVRALAGRMSTMALAAHQIAITCAAFTFMVPLGISSAAAVRVGNCIGRGDLRAARHAGWTAIALGAGFMACAAAVFLVARHMIARIFTPDQEVIHAGATLLLIAAVFQLFDGIQTVATGALRGAGDTRTPLIANFLAYWALGLPIGYVLGFKLGWGAPGLWIGLCIGLMIVGISLLAAWHRRTAAGARPLPIKSVTVGE